MKQVVRRSLLELVVAIVGGSLIGFGLTRAIGDLGWSTAIGVGLILVAVAYFALTRFIQTPITKYLLVGAGVIFLLLPAFQA